MGKYVTKVKLFLFINALVVLNTSCESNQNFSQTEITQAGVNKVTVMQVLQTTNYTYLQVKNGDKEQWLAVPKMEAAVGETYYFEGGMAMQEFESKELNRTFAEVFFLDRVYSTSDFSGEMKQPANPHGAADPHGSGSAIEPQGSVTTGKQEIKVEPAAGGVSIATLFEKKQNYGGKVVRTKGQVTKFSPGIMNRNWIHLQDGTESSGKYDLTVTTEGEAKVGDIITVEGTIALDKDLGYGYFYEVIMEDAKIVK